MQTTDSDRDLEDAKASLMAHVEELGRRFKEARDRLDLPSHIAAHPLLATGAALALGALLGMRRSIRVEPEGEARRTVAGALFAGLGAVALRFAKDFATREAADVAKRWWDQRQSTEYESSRDPSVEAFLRH